MKRSQERTVKTLPGEFSNMIVSDDAVAADTDVPVTDVVYSEDSPTTKAQQSANKSKENNLTDNIKALPNGKAFHLFFVYRTVSPDKDWVSSTVDKLESDYPGFKCGYHIRDFVPGRSVFDNISSCFRQSVKVAFVLTPQFLQSEWTKYETELAKCLCLNANDEHRVSLIPILLEECEVPDCLRDTTYLDIQGDTQCWLPKMVAAVTETADCGNSSEPQLSLVSRFPGGGNCWLLDVMFDVEDNLIVTDGINRAVKKFSMRGDMLSTIKFNSRPECLTHYEQSLFIVTFPEESCLRIINTKLEMEVVKRIPFTAQCVGISKINEETFAVVCRSKNAVLLCSKDAEIKSQISLTDSNTSNRTPRPLPSYLALSQDVMYVTEHSTEELLIIQQKTSDNQASVQRKTFATPRGMCIIGEHLLISAASVRLCTLNGDQIRDLSLPGVYHARALTYNARKRLVAITHKSDRTEEVSLYRVGTKTT